jgi:hypothetical protein
MRSDTRNGCGSSCKSFTYLNSNRLHEDPLAVLKSLHADKRIDKHSEADTRIFFFQIFVARLPETV